MLRIGLSPVPGKPGMPAPPAGGMPPQPPQQGAPPAPPMPPGAGGQGVPPEIAQMLATGGGPKPPQKDINDHDVDRTSQQIAGYMGPEMGPFECEHCLHWAGQNSCTLVTGSIDPHGCCNLFQKDPNKSEDSEPDADDDAKEPIGNTQGVDV